MMIVDGFFEARLTDLENRIDDLVRELAHAKFVAQESEKRINTITMLYESRVDQIYRRVSLDLQKYFGGASFDTVPQIEVEAQLSRLLFSAFRQSGAVDLDLKDAISDRLTVGTLSSPLTLRGFRLNRRRAREIGNGIEFYGTEAGIALYGPYKWLDKGHYSISASAAFTEVVNDGLTDNSSIVIDLYSCAEDKVHSLKIFRVEPHLESAAEYELDVSWLGGVVEIRVHNNTGRKGILNFIKLKNTNAYD